ncbi:MAG: hypothetical protein ACP5D9_03190 [Mariniphaga sp.]
MKRSVFISVLACFAIVVTLQSCKDDENENPEFIADDSSFSDFMNWTLEAENQGPDPALGPAHAGNDETVTRRVYFKDGQDPVGGEYPVGTIIVKHSGNLDQSVNEFTAMVKRGNDFNPDGGDWEWFMLNADGSIATDSESGMKMRGANLMNGMCVSCHSAGSVDYTFTK